MTKFTPGSINDRLARNVYDIDEGNPTSLSTKNACERRARRRYSSTCAQLTCIPKKTASSWRNMPPASNVARV